MNLDWSYIYRNLEPLAALKEAPALVEQLRALEASARGTAHEADGLP